MTAPNPTPRRTDGTAEPQPDTAFLAAANDDVALPCSAFAGPEPMMVVEFIGFTADESRRALASFPGGRRCALLRA